MSDSFNAYEILKKIIRISASSVPSQNKTEQILQSVSGAFQPERCFFIKPEEVIENGFLSRLISGKKPLWVGGENSLHEEVIHSKEKDLLRPPFAALPIFDGASFQGLLYLGWSNRQALSSRAMDLLLLIGEVLGTMVRNDDLFHKAEATISDLTSLYEMGKTVNSTLKLENLFELIVSMGLKILKAKGGVLRLVDRKTGEMKVKWHAGKYDQNPVDERIAKRVFYSRTPLSFNHSSHVKPTFSVLCVPFLSKGMAFGTLAFYDKDAESIKFDEGDFHLLLMMANQVSCVVENAMIHFDTSEIAQKYEKKVRELTTLWELNRALLITVNFERILQLTLTAITIGEGLKFNRAMLFLVNEKKHVLEGTLALGPDNAEEAGRIWSALSEKKGGLSDIIIRLYPNGHSTLNATVKGIQIPLERDQCILSRTVLEGRPFNIQFPQSEEGWLQTRCERGCHLGSEVGCYVGEHLGRDPKTYSFATVPLMGKGKVIGVILVDNLYNQNPITEEDIHFLSMFTSQAGLAIENALLYRNLEEVHQELQDTQNQLVHREKMAALGELSNSIAHEIKNPLTSIGGFARRLDRAVSEESQAKKYAQTIIKEADRLEKIFGSFSNYIKDEALALKELDLRDVLEESLNTVTEKTPLGKIQLVREYAEEVPRVLGDPYQLNQVFINLIHNACQAMKETGTLFLGVHPFSKNGTPYIKVEVKDTGKGIDQENLHNIFNPFYSTKEAHLGLGLPIVHKFITSHRGQVEVDNFPGQGVNFIVTLPASEKGRESRLKNSEARDKASL